MSEEKSRARAAGNGHEPGTESSSEIIRHSGQSGKSNAAQGLIESLSRRLLGIPSELGKPRGDEFARGGAFYALGVAAQRIGVEVDTDRVRALWQSVVDDFADDSAALAILSEVESAAVLPPEFGGPEPPETYPTLHEAKQILGETVYAWQPYIMSGGLNAIAGDVGSGKTVFGMDLHRRQWHGLEWPDGTPVDNPGRPVVWVMADQRLGQLAEAAANMDVPAESIILAAEKDKPTFPLTLDDQGHLERLSRIVRDVEPWAVIVDTFTSAMGTREHHKPEVMNPITTYLLDIAQSFRVPVVLMCHTNAEGGIYGKALGRKCEHQLSLVLSDRKDMTSPRNIHCRRSRRMEDTRSFGVIYHKSAWAYGSPYEEVEHSDKPPRGVKTETDVAAVALILESAGDSGVSLGDVVAALETDGRTSDAAKKAAQRALEKLRDAGRAQNVERRWFRSSSGGSESSSF